MEVGLYGLLGPNGAGKSTLMKILTDSIRPTSGHVYFNGKNIIALGSKYRSILGYMPQQQNLYDKFNGNRFLSYISALKEIPTAQVKDEIHRVLEICHLEDEITKKISAFSGGRKQRLLLAAALLGKPRVLILDEPSAGLDPKERVNLREKLLEISKNSIVIVATHVVSDIDTIADKILMLKRGILVANDTPEGLIQTYAPSGTIEDVYLTIFGEEKDE